MENYCFTYMKQIQFFIKNYWAILSLVLIVAVAGSIRLLWLGSAPKGVLVDEMHYGYLAYSILETGKDEHGVPFPLIFRGFGDNKLPGQVYTLVPFIKLFGLENFAIRLPSALAGTALVGVAYLLARCLKASKAISLTVAVSVAFMPWTFVLSRFGFESNLALLWWSIGILTALKWLENKNNWWAVLTGITFAMTWYFYIPYRPISAVLLGSLILLQSNLMEEIKKLVSNPRQIFKLGRYKELVSKLFTKKLFVGSMLLLVSFLAVISPFLLPQSLNVNTTRLNQVGIMNDPIIGMVVNENRTFCVEKFPAQFCYLLWNKGSVVGTLLIHRFVHTFSPQFLATTGEGEIPYLTIADTGQMQLLLYPFFVIGVGILLVTLVTTVKSKKIVSIKLMTQPLIPSKAQAAFILIGLLFTPIPALLVGNPQPVRLSAFIPFLIVSLTLGIDWVLHLLPSFVKMISASIFFILLGTSAVFFLTNFYSIHTLKNDVAYDSHLPSFFAFLETIPEDITIAYQQTISDPIMYYAYYTKVHPSEYQNNVVLGPLEESGFQHALGLGRFISTDKDHVQTGCDAYNTGKKAVFATRDKLDFPILYEAKSHHGVHTYIYVYEIMGAVDPKECQNR